MCFTFRTFFMFPLNIDGLINNYFLEYPALLSKMNPMVMSKRS
jgi:hypothetical protein